MTYDRSSVRGAVFRLVMALGAGVAGVLRCVSYELFLSRPAATAGNGCTDVLCDTLQLFLPVEIVVATTPSASLGASISGRDVADSRIGRARLHEQLRAPGCRS